MDIVDELRSVALSMNAFSKESLLKNAADELVAIRERLKIANEKILRYESLLIQSDNYLSYVVSDSYDGVISMSSPVASQLLYIRDALKREDVEAAELGLIAIADPGLSNINVWQDLERIALLPSTRMVSVRPSLPHEDIVEALTSIANGEARATYKIDKCLHEKYGYEHCESCLHDFAREALNRYYNHE